MAKDEAYRRAEQKIEEALQSGAIELDLSQGWNATDSEKLTELPELLGQLTQLQRLDLSLNQLRELPESLGQLTQLEQLWLQHNQLTALSESLRNLTVRRELFLHGNDNLGIPGEILGPHDSRKPADPTSILEYYFFTRGDQGSALRELKLLVVGRGGAGKTSLVKRLNGKPLDLNESETHGINISPLELKAVMGR